MVAHSTLKRPGAWGCQQMAMSLPENGPAKVEPDSPKGKKPSIPKDAAKRMHSKLQTLAKQGKPELQEAYKQRKSQKEKRGFFYGPRCV